MQTDNGDLSELHLARLIGERQARCPREAVFYYREHEEDAPARWLPVSWSLFAQRVSSTACALWRAGLRGGDRVAIFSPNHPVCFYADFAAFALRAVAVPVYATNSAMQLREVLNAAAVRVVFVGEQLQYDTLMSVVAQCPTVERVVAIEGAVQLRQGDSLTLPYDSFVAPEPTPDELRAVREATQGAQPDDMATLIFTSGTTGNSKGVPLLHANYRAAIAAHLPLLRPYLPAGTPVLDYLPQAHIFERAWCYVCFAMGLPVYINGNPHKIRRALAEVRPAAMCCVPRFWEKIYSGCLEQVEHSSPLRRALFADAIATGRRYQLQYRQHGRRAPLWLSLRYALYRRTVYRLIKRTIGLQRGTFFPTAGAATPTVVEEFIRAIDIPLVAGYGLTETTATVSLFLGSFAVGSAGRPLTGVEVKIGDNDEILVRGATVSRGYYNNPADTAQAFDADGWFHTGDAGRMRDGILYVTERIKDLFKTSNGKYIAPQSIENLLVADRYIDQAAVVADGRRFVAALLVPDFAQLRKYAQEHGLHYSTPRELVALPAVQELYAGRLYTLQQSLPGYERVKRFALLPAPFAIENGELTQTLKLKRSAINDHYAGIIESLYK